MKKKLKEISQMVTQLVFETKIDFDSMYKDVEKNLKHIENVSLVHGGSLRKELAMIKLLRDVDEARESERRLVNLAIRMSATTIVSL